MLIESAPQSVRPVPVTEAIVALDESAHPYTDLEIIETPQGLMFILKQPNSHIRLCISLTEKGVNIVGQKLFSYRVDRNLETTSLFRRNNEWQCSKSPIYDILSGEGDLVPYPTEKDFPNWAKDDVH